MTVNSNPDLDFERGATYRKYGFDVRGEGIRGEGMPYTWAFDLDGGAVEVENYWLPASGYEAALIISFHEKLYNHGFAHTTPCHVLVPTGQVASVALAPAAKASLDAR